MAFAAAGCDAGTQDDRPASIGSPVTLVAQNIGAAITIPVTRADGTTPSSLELAFDQLILPASISRQTFVLTDLDGNIVLTQPAYDPVARVVSLTPDSPLTAGQAYTLTIVTPQGPTDPNGLRSIGGATLAPSSPTSITFVVKAGVQPDPTVAHTADFCKDVLPVFQESCGTASCHGGSLPAVGLSLDSADALAATAIGRTSEEANVGAVASPPDSPGVVFGVDMAIIEPGAAADSWLMYKLLLAGAAPGAPPTAPATFDVSWKPIGEDALGTLSELVPGSGMPFAPGPALTLQQIETIGFWIDQGAPVVEGCE